MKGGEEQGEESVKKDTEEDADKEIQQQLEMYKTLGIETNLKAVQSYLDILLKEIKTVYKDEFLKNINTPIGLSAQEKLTNMHAYDVMNSESSLEMSTSLQQAILSIELYLNIEQKLMDANPSKNEISVELEHIHNKMIFDSLNEILDSFRPYGLVGQPYPWKISIKSNSPIPITEENMEPVLQKAEKKVLGWAKYHCGYYGDHDEFIQDKTQSFCEEYLAQMKEEKLAKMLSADVHEMEDKWINYDDEEAEV